MTTKKIEEMVRDELKDHVRAHNLDIPLNLATEEMRSIILEKMAALEAAAGSSAPNGAGESTGAGGEGGGEGQGSTSGDSGSSSDDSGDSSGKGDDSGDDKGDDEGDQSTLIVTHLVVDDQAVCGALPSRTDSRAPDGERPTCEQCQAVLDKPKRFVVERFSRYVVDGVINNLREGTLIRSEHYDVEEMRRQGVPLRDAREDEDDADKGLGHRFT